MLMAYLQSFYFLLDAEIVLRALPTPETAATRHGSPLDGKDGGGGDARGTDLDG